MLHFQITVDNREAGDVLVEKVDSIAFIKFPQNFTKALQQYALGISFDSNQTYSPELLVYANIDGGSEFYIGMIKNGNRNSIKFPWKKKILTYLV